MCVCKLCLFTHGAEFTGVSRPAGRNRLGSTFESYLPLVLSNFASICENTASLAPKNRYCRSHIYKNTPPAPASLLVDEISPRSSPLLLHILHN